MLSLVVLVGVSGSGKSTFARTHFTATEVMSSDFCRGLVADDENDQAATTDAFDVLHYIAGKRLARGRLTVVDATNVQPESARKPLVALAREHDVLPVAIVLDLPEKVCAARNASRPDRDFGPHVIRRQRDQLRRGLRGAAARGLPHRPRAALGGRGRRGDDRTDAALQRPAARDRSVRRDRRRARLPGRAGDAARRARVRRPPRRAGPRRRRAPPAGRPGCVRRRPGRPRAGHARACCGW